MTTLLEYYICPFLLTLAILGGVGRLSHFCVSGVSEKNAVLSVLYERAIIYLSLIYSYYVKGLLLFVFSFLFLT